MSAVSCASDASQAGVVELSAQTSGAPQKLHRSSMLTRVGSSLALLAMLGHLTAWTCFCGSVKVASSNLMSRCSLRTARRIWTWVTMWMTARQLEGCGDRMYRLVSLPVWCQLAAQVHCILFSCLIRVPALRSWCVIDVWTELLVLSIALTPKSLRSCLVVSVLSLSEPTCLKGAEQRSPDGSC